MGSAIQTMRVELVRSQILCMTWGVLSSGAFVKRIFERLDIPDPDHNTAACVASNPHDD